ncbi:hypothetical protein COV42_01670 [Candidatus Campbellbacteria bacterium CG11_big_fil_rev_8_21_14_0_20_44_21]|uniref:HTH arsR-type domain-containing protein n=1 Tax=Candidatus Campbellbacteria bacterium CG22_combo_CG10-13_8_21_14_all_43_18 TaxID=1974530 RepID=A0A2H0DX66_9BACT|nr:MAG: hypothetical protein COW82_00265 [Candidatus Campbellbacteria bacterium CG22_combo_CG10-13_8_21_14_all_43_18]PIR24264.1 MAG: hypothetical protein COV42_01670 [Candidatus Campbellbacteria bacterium CG11_big_fil_rev_8_21_14_0_20_44_21]
MQRWATIFKTLSNPNRLKIIKILSNGRKFSVSDISKKLDISPNATSKHLVMLKDLSVLEAKGKNNNVYYFLNKNLPADFKKAVKIFI